MADDQQNEEAAAEKATAGTSASGDSEKADDDREAEGTSVALNTEVDESPNSPRNARGWFIHPRRPLGSAPNRTSRWRKASGAAGAGTNLFRVILSVPSLT